MKSRTEGAALRSGSGVGLGAWLFSGILIAGAAAGVSWVDVGSREWVQKIGLRGDIERVIKLMEIFAHGTGLLVTGALIWTLAPGYRRSLPRLLAAYGLAGLVVNLTKLLIPRLRPSAGVDANLPETALNWDYLSQSFPSGHSAAAVALGLSLAILFPRGQWVFMTLAGLACLQRVVFDAHWPSDVLAGAAIGVWAVAVVYRTAWADRLFNRIENAPIESAER
jgi:membrane-associated phospholipid phosphatase